MKVTYEGQDYEFVGYNTSKGTHFLNYKGDLSPRSMRTGIEGIAYFHLVPVRHTFGGIVFEETGEERPAQPGEWILYDKAPVFISSGSSPFFILKPVEVIDEDNQG